ncbi:MAG TPA: AAA family ATPase, partial [archaeon]|nr:AAA family ATPase [archaeon]
NIILQGDVTNIIEMNPIERRYIIDEISGIAEYNDKKEKSQKDLEAVDQKLKEAEIVITERYDIFKKLEDERNAAIKYQNLQKELIVLKASLAHRKLVDFEQSSKTIEEEVAKKEEENKNLEKEVASIESELENRERSIQEVAGKLLKFSKKFEIEREASNLRTKIMIYKDKIDSNRREIERLDSLIEKLEGLESRKDIEGMPRAVRAVLGQRFKGVFGTVVDLIKVPEDYSVAIEVTAASHFYDIVVEDENVAKFCIEFLKKDKIGRASFIPLNKISPKSFDGRDVLGKKGVVGIASKLIKFDPRFESAMQFVFGSTLIVDDLEVARNIGIGKARMVTLDGDLVERSGLMVGGYFFRTHPKLVQSMAKDDIENYREGKKKLDEDIRYLTGEIAEYEERLKKYSKSEDVKDFVDFEKLKVDSEKEIDKLRLNRKMMYERKLILQQELSKLNVQKAKLEAEFENVKVEALQYGEVEFIDKGIRTLENGIREAQQQLIDIGAVNFKSIDQYDNFKTEFDEYKRKYEKILEEKKAVLGMMEKIEEKRRDIFNRCLQDVSKHFNDVFNKMTKGNASLELENPMDLESGLIIQANPAGKTLVNIDSLSGGEKTLTALAFLFAIQEYRPAPFYILDEIDAALDKENSKKVAELIKVMSKEAQFLTITHNDQTIKYGDTIYGVTISSGESKILGLELPK